MAPLMATISGIRGIWGQSLTPSVCSQYIQAFLQVITAHREESDSREIVLGADSRTSGNEICQIVAYHVLQMGYTLTFAGIVPTPTIQFAVLERHALAGVIVTSSHNPGEWNGLKFVDKDSLFLSPELNQEMFRIVQGITPYVLLRTDMRLPVPDPTIGYNHMESVLKLPYVSKFDPEHAPHVSLDTINGAGGVLLPALLRELGCRVSGINLEQNGLFAREPEPISTNLGAFGSFVRAQRADLGLVVDPDADRLAIVNERGEPICEELTLTIAVDYVLNIWNGKFPEEFTKGDSILVVKNLSTTRAVDDVVARFNERLKRGAESRELPPARVMTSAVGEINVGKVMQREHALIGGEGNGGVMLPQCHIGRDSLVGTVLVMAWYKHMRTLFPGQPFSRMVEELPRWHICKDKIEMTREQADTTMRNLVSQYTSEPSYMVSQVDGVRIDAPDWWVHIRGSNTEPVVRVICEARSQTESQALCRKWIQQLRSTIV